MDFLNFVGIFENLIFHHIYAEFKAKTGPDPEFWLLFSSAKMIASLYSGVVVGDNQ